jgi:hypothetical protein
MRGDGYGIDVEEAENQAVDAVVSRAVGPNAHQSRTHFLFRLNLHLTLDSRPCTQYGFQASCQINTAQLVREVREGPATVARAQRENVRDSGREPGYAQIAIHKKDGGINAVDQVLQVGVEMLQDGIEIGKRLVLVFKLPIDGVELLVSCRQFLDQAGHFLPS